MTMRSGSSKKTRSVGHFAHLPPRLRYTWQSYHKKFHVTDLVEKEGGVDRVRVLPYVHSLASHVLARVLFLIVRSDAWP